MSRGGNMKINKEMMAELCSRRQLSFKGRRNPDRLVYFK